MNAFRMNYIIEELPDVKFSSANALNPHEHNLQNISSESSGESLTYLIHVVSMSPFLAAIHGIVCYKILINENEYRIC
jgi:hypothetical protein